MKHVKNEKNCSSTETTNKSNKNPHNSIGLSAFDIASLRLEAGQSTFKTTGLA